MEGALPHLLFYAAAVGIGAFGYRAFKRAAKRVHERTEQLRREAETGAAGTLERDPDTGHYKLRRD